MFGMLLRPDASTTTPSRTCRPEASAAAVFGVMPMPITTASASKGVALPDTSITTPSPVVRMPSSCTPVRRSTPLSRCSPLTAWPIAVPRMRASGTGTDSNTVTATPAAAAVAAISRPMKPAPTMASRLPGTSTRASATASSRVRR